MLTVLVLTPLVGTCIFIVSFSFCYFITRGVAKNFASALLREHAAVYLIVVSFKKMIFTLEA